MLGSAIPPPALTVAIKSESDAPLADRIDYLQASLDESNAPARLWFFGWAAAYTAGLAVRTTLAYTASSEGVRVDSQVGALTLGAGLVSTAIFYPRSAYAAGKLRSLPSNTLEQQRNKVAEGERLLAESAYWEGLGHSLVPHLAGLTVNLAAGLYLWLDQHRFTSGLVAFGGGTLITELKIFTEPITASPALNRYRADTWKRGGGATPRVYPELSIGLGTFPLGVLVTGSF
ncbi:MAG: hypothetical protein ABUS79_07760 [Pseudomonadota bacterium]